MIRLLATGASRLPSFPQTLEGEGYSANLRQRMVPRYRRAGTFGTAANALDGSATPQFSMSGVTSLPRKRRECFRPHGPHNLRRLHELDIHSGREWRALKI